MALGDMQANISERHCQALMNHTEMTTWIHAINYIPFKVCKVGTIYKVFSVVFTCSCIVESGCLYEYHQY